LHDWAVEISNQLDVPRNYFDAGHTWISKFKKRHNIVKRKIVSFSSSSVESEADLVEQTNFFVQKAREEMRKYSPQFVVNSDQSGIQRMMPSKTTLESKGTQKVLAKITNESGLTHSYTIQTAMSMVKLLPKIYVVCQESNEGANIGQFGPGVTKTIFTAPNLVTSCSPSGKCMKFHVTDFNERVLKQCMDHDFLYLLDSWTPHKDNKLFQCFNRDTVQCNRMIIPPGCTGRCQPKDVGFFRVLKSIVRRFYDAMPSFDSSIKMHQRNNYLKMLSLIHHQLCSPKFHSFIKYAWHKSGYTDTYDPFPGVMDSLFNNRSPRCFRCSNTPFITCAYCDTDLCLLHFFIENHNHFE